MYLLGNVVWLTDAITTYAVWGTGQDQARILKLRLKEVVPDATVFLDVDDLKEGKGAEAVDASSSIIVFCSAGYFTSPSIHALFGTYSTLPLL